VNALGPLVVSQRNPHYFTAGEAGDAVYLAGSHIWKPCESDREKDVT